MMFITRLTEVELTTGSVIVGSRPSGQVCAWGVGFSFINDERDIENITPFRYN